MEKILSYPLSILYTLVFFIWLLIFHPIQWVCFNLFGYNAHRISVAYLNLCLVRTAHLLGTTYHIKGMENVPENKPLIIVANHQSLHDITTIIWFLRKVHPKFISKIELGKGIPSVSYNLTHGGSVLIDRSDARQALSALKEFGQYIEKNNYTAVIFPEGTRSKDGVPKRFSENGLKMLTKFAPSAYVIPMTINNCWKLNRYGMFPLEVGVNITFELHEPIKADSLEFVKLFEKVENTIKNAVI